MKIDLFLNLNVTLLWKHNVNFSTETINLFNNKIVSIIVIEKIDSYCNYNAICFNFKEIYSKHNMVSSKIFFALHPLKRFLN